MPNRAAKNKNTRKLIRWGKTSLGLTLPADLIYTLGWKEKQKVKVVKIRGGLAIKDWKK